MLYLRSFNRFILISLMLLGFSISPVKSDTVIYGGPFGELIPLFDPIMGTLDLVVIDYVIDIDIFVDGEISGGPGPVLGDVTIFGHSTLVGAPAAQPLYPFAEDIGPVGGILGSATGPISFHSGSTTGGITFFSSSASSASFGVLPYIGIGDYTLIPDIVAHCISSGLHLISIGVCSATPGFVHFNTVAYHFTPLPSAVPIPAAVWLFCSALAGLGLMRRKPTV